MTTEPYDSSFETGLHIERVDELLEQVRSNLSGRGIRHDASKLKDPEKVGWDKATPKLKELTYGTDEYRASLRDIRPIIEHHYKNNSHHPEYYANGLNGMSLLDLIEMICDWKAASERGKGNDFMEGLKHNQARFDMSDQLYDILVNTARELDYDKT